MEKIEILFLEHKETKNEYVVFLRYKVNELVNNEVNELVNDKVNELVNDKVNELVNDKVTNKALYNKIYNALFNDSIDYENKDINFIKLFYIKRGIHIYFTETTWNTIINNYLKNIKIIKLLDIKYITKIKNTDIILFELNAIQDDFKDFIHTLFMKYYKINS